MFVFVCVVCLRICNWIAGRKKKVSGVAFSVHRSKKYEGERTLGPDRQSRGAHGKYEVRTVQNTSLKSV